MSLMTFPFPDSKLSPNARIDRRALFHLKREAKDLAYLITRESNIVVISPEHTEFQLTLTFYPPDRRKRDLDNLYASFKAYQDGMFAALGVDDSKIDRVILQRGNPLPNGQVIVDIREA